MCWAAWWPGGGTAGHAPYYVVAYLIGGAVAVIGVFLSIYLRTRVPDSSTPPPQEEPAQLDTGQLNEA